MKRLVLFLSALVLFGTISCTKSSLDLNPDSYLTKEDQMGLKMELSRYMDKLPPRTTMEMRWDTSRNEYYQRGGELMELVKLYKSDTSQFYYFYITRVAPSVRENERKAIGGKCTYQNNRIGMIEEFFITEVKNPEVLEEHAEELLTEVIKVDKAPVGNALIEWPNDYFYYNKGTNQWDRVSSRGISDSLNNSVKIQ